MERQIADVKKKSRDEVLNTVNRQEESSEVRTFGLISTLQIVDLATRVQNSIRDFLSKLFF